MIYFVDFEASSLLPGSFPIEVAWVDMHGHGESYLIRPADEWLDDRLGNAGVLPTGWSYQSEAVHGISLDMLMREGAALERVAKRAVDVLSPRGVMAFSDAPGYDGAWMDELLAAGGQRKSWDFRGRKVTLLDVTQAYGWACRPLLDTLDSLDGAEREDAERLVRWMAMDIITRAQQAEATRARVQHRALADAESLWRTWRAVREEVERHAG